MDTGGVPSGAQVSKPQASGLTSKGESALLLVSGLVLESFPLLCTLWTSALANCKSRPPAGLQAMDRHAELRARPGLAGPEGDIDSVHTGALRHAERASATVTTAQLVPPRGSHSCPSPAHPQPCTALDLHDHCLHDFPTGPPPLPCPQSTLHKATSWVILKCSAHLTPPCHLLDKTPGVHMSTGFP